MKSITIGFLSRERFEYAAQGLQRIIDSTRLPFNLIVVNNNYPEEYWKPVAAIIEQLDNVKVIEAEQLITANQARNLIIRENKSDFLCLIENDIKVEEGWLSHLVDACEELSAEVAVPLILEPFESSDIVHFDTKLGHIRSFVDDDGKPALQILRRNGNNEDDREAGKRTVELIEMHCILFRKSVLDRIGPFDNMVRGTRQEIDLSLSLFKAGAKIVFSPQSVITFIPPPPLYPAEKSFFEFIWDIEAAVRDEKFLREKWNIHGFPGAVEFAEDRLKISAESDPEKQIDPLKAYMDNRQETIELAADDLSKNIPAGEQLILVNDMRWSNEEVAPGYQAMPFLEKDGVYWGSPEDDETAISELNRMRSAGPKFIAFGQPAFWWLDHYSGFNDYLRSHFNVVLENDRLVIFDLQEK